MDLAAYLRSAPHKPAISTGGSNNFHAGGLSRRTLAGVDNWGRIAWIAAQQHGVVALTQALAVGVSADAVQRRAREQRWVRAHRGVYVMPGHPVEEATVLMAALLFAGPQSALAGLTAGKLWGVVERAPDVPTLVVPSTCHVGQGSNVGIQRSRTLTRHHVTTLGVLRVTQRHRTLCDLASVMSASELREAVAKAGQRDMTAVRAAVVLAEKLTHMRGRARLLQAARDVLGEGRTDSVAERRLRRILLANGLRPAPGVFSVVDRGRLLAMADIAFPEQRLIIEMDGFAYHATPAQLRADHQRQNRLEAAGWTVLRASVAVLARPEDLLAQVHAILARRR